MKDDLQKYQHKPIAFVWQASKPYWVWLLLTILSYQIYNILTFFVGYPLKYLIDDLPSFTQLSDGFFVVGLLVAILLISDIALRITRYFAVVLEKKIRVSVSQKIVEHTLEHSVEYFAKRMSGTIVNRNVSIARSLMGILENTLIYGLLPGVVGIIVSVSIFSSLNSVLVWVFFIWLVPFVTAVVLLNKPLGSVAEELAKKESKYVGMLSDTIGNHSTIRLFNGTETEFNRLKPSFLDATNAWVKEIAVWEWSQFVKSTITLFLYVGVYVSLIVLYLNNEITLGDVAFSVSIIVTAAETIRGGAMSIASYYGNKGSLKDNLGELLEPHDVVDPPKPEDLRVTEGALLIENIKFGYPKKKAIFKDLTLSISSKQKIGVVGTSGAGKTSLISILLRLYDLKSGSICIDGQDISKVSQHSLRKNITYVPQDPYLFNRSIKENILYGSEQASKKDVIAAAKMAQAHDFIMELPDKYDSIVGERGVLLSGGQKQRITIARAFIKNSPILIMDEATSALDSESEASIQIALKELVKDKTVIVVAHRLSTLLMMDRIIVLDGGEVSEDGSHRELVAEGGIYASLWKQQTGDFIE